MGIGLRVARKQFWLGEIEMEFSFGRDWGGLFK